MSVVVGCLLKERLTKGGGGSRAPQDPPGYDLVLLLQRFKTDILYLPITFRNHLFYLLQKHIPHKKRLKYYTTDHLLTVFSICFTLTAVLNALPFKESKNNRQGYRQIANEIDDGQC